ncbi:MAG TPA: adenylate/guanylate cyclase domain-containing protein [Candidatus Limnocylindrales bacterium]|nr:adenylate/guanylate cyclase domain-containing protein [Candidatus Limnocylindrales bacterium]
MSDPSGDLPTGTVTFLFTDIEGSTRLIERVGDAYPGLLETQRSLIGSSVDEAGGHVFGTEGDAVFAAFDRPSAAIVAAADAQRRLAAHGWPEGVRIRVRMGIHTGEARLVDGDYVGLEVHRAARIASAAHGGQVLVSEGAALAAGHGATDSVTLRDLGLHRLKDLSRPERIAQLEIAGLTGEFPPIRTLEATPNNLPIQLTSFVGREIELAEARALLVRTRLLTLTGPGGTGKTRLALALAAELTDEFLDGVRWVALESVSDAGLVSSAIAEAVAVEDLTRPPIDRIVAHLEDKRVLLVLDNFEQVVAAAPAIAEILRRTSAVKAIVTSRIALDISGEQHYPVPPLPLPTPEDDAPFDVIASSPAVLLFADRAMSMKPDFRLMPDNAIAIARIVRGLDGLPLAIELAAARIRLLTPAAIEARLGDRLALLASTSRDLTDRQRTIRGAIAWSHDLLSDPDRRLFARFGVFVGGAALDEVEQVCGPSAELGRDVLEGIQSLADQSLARALEDEHGDPRFAMYMTIAEFARERLAEEDEATTIRERHARAYLALAEALSGSLMGPQRRRATDRLADDHDNLRAALDTFVELGLAEEAERLVAAIWRFWQFRGHLDEAATRTSETLALSDGRAADGTPRRSRLHALAAAGGIAYWRGDVAAGHRAYSEAERLARELGDRAEIGEALFNLSFAPATDAGYGSDASIESAVDLGWDLLERSLVEFRAAGDDLGAARVLWQQGDILSYRGDLDRAETALAEALALFERRGDHYWIAWARHILALVRMGQGDLAAADAELRAALRAFDEAGDLTGIALLMFDAAELAYRAGDVDRAWRLGGSGLALGRRTGSLAGTLPPADPRYLIFALARNDPTLLEEAVTTAPPLDAAIAEALGGILS